MRVRLHRRLVDRRDVSVDEVPQHRADVRAGLALGRERREIIGTRGLAPGVDLQSLGLPDTVQGAIVSRVDRLEPAAQLVLKLASVVGREFPLRIVEALYPDADQDLDALLAGLVDIDLVQREGEGGDAHYLFKHALGRDAVYGLMLFAQRRGVHQQVAEWYEADTDDPSKVCALLAHHWSHTDVHDKAVHYLREAGDQAVDRFANVEAARLFERALERAAQAPSVADSEAITSMEQGLAVAHYALSNYDRCVIHGRNALARLGQSAPSGLAGKILGVLGQVARRLLQSRFPGKVEDEAEKARRLAAVRIYTVFSEIGFFTEQAVDALYASLRQLNLAVPVGPTPELAQAYANMAAMVGAIPIRSVASAWAERCRNIADEVGDQQARAWAYCRSAVTEMYFGRWEQVEALTSEAMAVAENLGDRRLREDSGVVRGLGLVYSGHFHEGVEVNERVRAFAATSGNPQTQAWATANTGLALARLGRAQEGLPLFAENRAWVEEVATSTERIYCHASQALTCLAAGESQRALEWADRTLPAIDGARPIAYWTQHAPSCLGETYRRLLADKSGDAELHTKLRKSAKAAVAFGKVFKFGRPSGLYWSGVMHATDGRNEKAIAAWQRCIAESTEMGNRLELGLAHRDLAKVLPTGDSRRQEHRLEAERVLTEAGAVWDLV